MIKHKWLFPSSLEEAKCVQKEIAEQVITYSSAPCSFAYIGGMDVSNNPFDPAKRVFASTVLLNSSLCLDEHAGVFERQDFPYITGFLGFREAPVLLKAFQKLSKRPDIILVDGQGIAHPRGLGIASHIGVLLDIPTIGVAKSLLIGDPVGVLGENPGDWTPLVWKNNRVGALVRTKKNCKPLVISIGHKIDLENAINVVVNATKGYRLPEPIRYAHFAANNLRRQAL